MPVPEAINTNVFAVDEDFIVKPDILNTNEEPTQKSPSSFLEGLASGNEKSAPSKPEVLEFIPKSTTAFSEQPFAPSGTPPSFSMNSLSGSSPLAQNVVTQMKERMNAIKPWKDFFSFDQFHLPQSSTAAQSRVSHNVSHFQNNYLMFVLLLAAFSL